MNKKLFVGNCDFGLEEAALQAFIEENGIQVSSVKIIRDRYTNRSRGFGFVELSGSEDMDKAIEALNGKELEGRALVVNVAREPRTGGGGGGDMGGGGGRGGDRGGRGRDRGGRKGKPKPRW